MLIEPPIRTFVVGVLASELMQWGFWRRKNKGAAWGGYLTAQWDSLIGNVGVDLAVAVLWAYGGLDLVLAQVVRIVPGASEWTQGGIPFTPPMGLLLGCLCDFFGDDVAYNGVQILRKRLAWLLGSPNGNGNGTATKPAPPEGGV